MAESRVHAKQLRGCRRSRSRARAVALSHREEAEQTSWKLGIPNTDLRARSEDGPDVLVLKLVLVVGDLFAAKETRPKAFLIISHTAVDSCIDRFAKKRDTMQSWGWDQRRRAIYEGPQNWARREHLTSGR